jgi:NAD(P)-dependent dehydrogenase (short-subunit alcohol dehydrogenase family)
MIIDLTGLWAVVTGSTSGIGFAIVRGLAGSGAAVVVNGRSQKNVDTAVARLIRELPQAKVEGVTADLATADGAAALVARVPVADILVNNLGIFEPKTVRRDFRCRLAALLRDQRYERRADVASLPAGDGGERVGPGGLHL